MARRASCSANFRRDRGYPARNSRVGLVARDRRGMAEAAGRESIASLRKARHEPPVLASQRVGAKRRPMINSAKCNPPFTSEGWASLPNSRFELRPTGRLICPDGQSVGSPKSCLVAGEDDEKASQRISEIQKISLANGPKSLLYPSPSCPQRGVRTSRTRSGMRWTRQRQASNSEPDE
jgi:hypothetical protein